MATLFTTFFTAFFGALAVPAPVEAFAALLGGIVPAVFLAGVAFFAALRRAAGPGLALARDALRAGFAGLGAFRVFRDFEDFARAAAGFWRRLAALPGRFVARAALEVRRPAFFLAMPV